MAVLDHRVALCLLPGVSALYQAGKASRQLDADAAAPVSGICHFLSALAPGGQVPPQISLDRRRAFDRGVRLCGRLLYPKHLLFQFPRFLRGHHAANRPGGGGHPGDHPAGVHPPVRQRGPAVLYHAVHRVCLFRTAHTGGLPVQRHHLEAASGKPRAGPKRHFRLPPDLFGEHTFLFYDFRRVLHEHRRRPGSH